MATFDLDDLRWRLRFELARGARPMIVACGILTFALGLVVAGVR